MLLPAILSIIIFGVPFLILSVWYYRKIQSPQNQVENKYQNPPTDGIRIILLENICRVQDVATIEQKLQYQPQQQNNKQEINQEYKIEEAIKKSDQGLEKSDVEIDVISQQLSQQINQQAFIDKEKKMQKDRSVDNQKSESSDLIIVNDQDIQHDSKKIKEDALNQQSLRSSVKKSTKLDPTNGDKLVPQSNISTINTFNQTPSGNVGEEQKKNQLEEKQQNQLDIKGHNNNIEQSKISETPQENNIIVLKVSEKKLGSPQQQQSYGTPTPGGSSAQQQSIFNVTPQVDQSQQQQKQNNLIFKQYERVQNIFLVISCTTFIQGIIGRIYVTQTKNNIELPWLFILSAFNAVGVVILYNCCYSSILCALKQRQQNSESIVVVARFVLIYYGLIMTFPLYAGLGEFVKMDFITILIAIFYTSIIQIGLMKIEKCQKWLTYIPLQLS